MTRSRRAAALAVLCAGSALWVVDLSAVFVLLPSAQAGLRLVPTDVQWVPIAFAVSFGGGLLVSGRLADAYTRRRVFAAGAALFAVASALASVSPSLAPLLVARVLAGVAAALLVPSGLALVTTLYESGRARPRALGIYGAVTSGGLALGGVLGGALTDILGWRAAVAALVPLAFPVVPLALLLIPPDQPSRERARLRLVPAVLLTLGAAGVLYCLQAVTRGGDAVGTGAALALTLICVVGFVATERAAAGALVPPALLRRRELMGANATGLLLVAAGDGVLFVVTYYSQTTLAHAARVAGLAIAAFGVAALLGGLMVGRLLWRLGARGVLAGGLAVQASAILLLAPLRGGGAVLLVAMAALGWGNILALVAVIDRATVRVPDRDRGAAGGLLQTCQQIGAAAGVALVAAVTAGGTTNLRPALLVAAAITLAALPITYLTVSTMDAPARGLL